MKLVYLAVPYSHPEWGIRRARYEQAIEAVDALLKRGVMVMCGRVLVEELRTEDPEALWPLFRTLIDHADEMWILALPGYSESRGIRRELEYALKQNKRVRYLDPADLAQAA